MAATATRVVSLAQQTRTSRSQCLRCMRDTTASYFRLRPVHKRKSACRPYALT